MSSVGEDSPELKLHTDVAEMKGMLNIALANHTLQLGEHGKAIEVLNTTVAQHGERINAIGDRVTVIDHKVNGQWGKVMAVLTPVAAGLALVVTVVFDVLNLLKK